MLLFADKFGGKGNDICTDCVFMLLLEDKSEEKRQRNLLKLCFLVACQKIPKNVYLNIENIIVIRYNQRRHYIIINKRKRGAK